MIFNDINFDTYFNHYPDENGYFGRYGGVYVDDKLKAAMADPGHPSGTAFGRAGRPGAALRQAGGLEPHRRP